MIPFHVRLQAIVLYAVAVFFYIDVNIRRRGRRLSWAWFQYILMEVAKDCILVVWCLQLFLWGCQLLLHDTFFVWMLESLWDWLELRLANLLLPPV
ncbi:hypothetical protein V8F20_004783 [Naviculisporaceae sp. PSN 640]